MSRGRKRKGAPTHVLWREDGTVEFVTLDGYSPDNPDLTPMPPGIDPEACGNVFDHQTRTIRRDPDAPRRRRRAAAEAWLAAMPDGALDLLAARLAQKLGRKD